MFAKNKKETKYVQFHEDKEKIYQDIFDETKRSRITSYGSTDLKFEEDYKMEEIIISNNHNNNNHIIQNDIVSYDKECLIPTIQVSFFNKIKKHLSKKNK